MNSGLNTPQQSAVEHVVGPLLILAGAGSGKTRVITQRAAYLVQQGLAAPQEILCVTFTNKACREMAGRIESIIGHGGVQVDVRTFHSFGLQLIRRGDVQVEVDPSAVIYDDADQRQLMRDVLQALKIDTNKASPRVVLNFIEQFKRRAWLPADVESDEMFGGVSIREIYELYQETLTRNSALDFGDLLLLPLRALKSDPAAVKRLQDRYRYFMVDEFQDTNEIQYELIKLLAAGDRNLAVVGDDDQSIYAWRGANIANILGFEDDFPEAKVVKLEQNYRSTSVILDAAWEVVKHNPGRREKKLWTDQQGGAKIQYAALADEREESDWVAKCVDEMIRAGTRPTEIAIFYRANSQSRTLEEALRQRGIAHRIVGSTGFFGRKEIKDVLAYLKLLVNPRDLVAFSRIANVPRRGIGKTSLERVVQVAIQDNLSIPEAVRHATQTVVSGKPAKALSEFVELMDTYSGKKSELAISTLAAELITEIGLKQSYESEGVEIAQDRRENIDQLLISLQDFEKDAPEATLEEYLDTVSLIQDISDAEEEVEAVSLMTFHSAKGLEFDVVFMTGLEDGILPHTRSIDEGNEDEERRLCYVGMTRARKKLYLSRARTRRTFGARMSQRQSPFLRAIPKDLLDDISPRASQSGFPFQAPPRRSTSGYDQYSQVPPKPVVAPTNTDVPAQFKVGNELKHPTFGVGEILSVSEGSHGYKLKMRFAGGTKTILPKLVELTQV